MDGPPTLNALFFQEKKAKWQNFLETLICQSLMKQHWEFFHLGEIQSFFQVFFPTRGNKCHEQCSLPKLRHGSKYYTKH